MNRPVRVLFVHGNLEMGGAERLNIHLIAALRRAGMHADLFLVRRAGALVEEARTLGIEPLYGVDGPGRLRGGLAATAVKLPRLARRYDLLVGGVEIAMTSVAAAAGLLARRPVAGQVHIDLASPERPRGPLPLRTVSRLVYPRLAAVVGVSPAATASTDRLGVNPRRRVTIPNGVDAAFLREKASGPPPLAGPYILGVGRLTRQKGFDRLLAAFGEVHAAGLPHRLVLVGDGPERPRLEQQARALGLGEDAVFAGPDSNPWRYMANAALVCFPSRYEGFGLVLAEAMTLGVPVVATDDSPPVRALLADGQLGAVVPAASLGQALLEVLRDPAASQARARRAAEAAAGMTIEASAQRYARLFERVVAKR